MTSRRLTYQVTVDTDGHQPDIEAIRTAVAAAAEVANSASVVVMLTGNVVEHDEDDEVARLERAYRGSFVQTTGPIEMHALAYIKAMILRDFPTATLLLTGDSDQGPGYVFESIEDADGNTLCEDETQLDVDLWAPLSDLRRGYLHAIGVDPYAIPLTTTTTTEAT